MRPLFDYFPKVYYDQTGNLPIRPIIATNLLMRIKFNDIVKKNAALYYTYDVKDSDTPEIIADKYYENPGLHWIVLWANDIVDPFYDWVLPYPQFIAYLESKYGSVELAQTTILHYIKRIQKTDSVTGLTNETILQINADEDIPVTANTTYNLVNGSTVRMLVTKEPVYAYDYENDLNEAKRTIILIDKTFVPQILQEMKALTR